ncbi:MAG TPA: NRDE family protein [Actinospica sp.]|nr:NRDE family protein [Actinospica sp.]
MCTALISLDPGSSVPVLLLFARDEMADRAWQPPARHWPDRPTLVGGRDERLGGTWLAVRPGDQSAGPRVACLLNGLGPAADPERRLTRGDLPLIAASGGFVSDLDLGRYDPFHLLIADAASVSLLTWDGGTLTDRKLAPGTHLVSNRGLEVEDEQPSAAPERAEVLIEARIRHFRPLLRSTPRPEPVPGHGLGTRAAWGPWMRLAEGDGLDTGDVRALIGRHDWGGEHGLWLTSSVSLVAVGSGGVRYDLNPAPGGAHWYEVVTA